MKKIFLGAIFTSLFIINSAYAAADTCTWTGATDANWSVGTNWSGCDNGGVPENGDILIFPDTASNKSLNNDLIGFAPSKIEVTGTGYSISGLAFTLSGTVGLVSSEDLIINSDIAYTAFNINIAASAGKTITVNGVTNFVSGGGEVNVGGPVHSGTVNFVGNIVGNAGSQFIAVNSASLRVQGAANTYTAGTVGAESAAAFNCYSATCFGDNTNDIYSGGGSVNFRVAGTYSNDIQTSITTPDISAFWAYDDVTLNGNTTVNDDMWYGEFATNKTLTINGDINLVGGNLEVSGVDRTSTTAINGIISGANSVYAYSSTLILDGANTYTGTTAASSGGATIKVTNASGLGASSAGTSIGSGDVLKFDFAVADTVAEPLIISGNGEGNGALVQVGETTTLSGGIVLMANSTVGVDSTAGFSAFMLSGVISGTGDLTLTTSASTTYTNSSIQFTGPAANTYVGKTIVSGVRFYPSKAHNVVAVPGNIDILATATKNSEVVTAFSESIANSSNIVLTNNGSQKAFLQIGTGATETIGSITGNGEVSLGAVATLNLSSSASYDFYGQISKFNNFPVGDSVIRKSGAGTVSFLGGVNTSYVGGETPVVIVDGGFLNIAGLSLASVPVTATGTGAIRGSGSASTTTATAGGKIRPFACLTVSSLTMAAGGVYNPDISGTTACSDYDKVIVTGTADLNGGILNLGMTYGTPAVGDTFTILTAGSVVGTFNGLPNGSTIAIGSVTYRINYTATSVVITVETSPFGSPAPVSSGSGAGLVYVPSSALDPRLTLTTAASSTGVNTPGVITGSCANKFTTHTSFGKTGAAVTLLQSFLNEREGAKLPVTGYFGSLTRAAVKAFQVKYGIQYVTGNQYELTTQKLNEISCK